MLLGRGWISFPKREFFWEYVATVFFVTVVFVTVVFVTVVFVTVFFLSKVYPGCSSSST